VSDQTVCPARLAGRAHDDTGAVQPLMVVVFVENARAPSTTCGAAKFRQNERAWNMVLDCSGSRLGFSWRSWAEFACESGYKVVFPKFAVIRTGRSAVAAVQRCLQAAEALGNTPRKTVR